VAKPLESYSDLIVGERIFRVPKYQRNYSWEKKQWQDIWDDMTSAENPRPHFFGTIILRKVPEKERSGITSGHYDVCDIIDGQQRICTALIFLREVCNQWKQICDLLPSGPEKESANEDLQNFSKDYFKRQAIYKLELLNEDRDFFKSHIIEGQNFPDEKVTPSQKRLSGARKFFNEQLESEKTRRKDQFTDFLFELKDRIRRMEILRYEVENTQDAVFLFETVNDRGKKLSNLEKTKSFLMHMIIQSASSTTNPDTIEIALNEINEKFSRIFRYLQDILENEKRARFIGELGQDKEDAIQRYHFTFYESPEQPWDYLDGLHKKMRDQWKENKEECPALILSYATDLEKAFFAMREIITYDEEDNIGKSLKQIFSLGRVANFFPLLISYWMNAKDNDESIVGIEKILALIEKYVVKVYVVGRRRADAGNKKLHTLAYRIRHEKVGLDTILGALKQLIERYQDENAFKKNLEAENFGKRTSRRDIRYMMFQYEETLGTIAKEPLEHSLENILSEDFSIEHIWAQNPNELGLSEDALENVWPKYVERIGNLTIAANPWNSSMGNKPFVKKKEYYKDSSLRVQRELTKYSEWGKDQIDERGKTFMDFVLEQWRT